MSGFPGTSSFAGTTLPGLHVSPGQNLLAASIVITAYYSLNEQLLGGNSKIDGFLFFSMQ